MCPFRIPEQITPVWFKAMVLQLNPDGDEDDDAEQQIREALEKRFERELAKAFDEQLDTLLPEDASDETVRNAPSMVTATSEPVREVLRRNLESGAELGVSVAFDTLEQVGMAFDYTLAHSQAAKWASTYSYELVRGINTTTQARMQTAIDDWFRERTTLPDLIRELEPTFGRKRAKLIAQTETTRSASEGTLLGYKESGVVDGKTWAVANDEKMCPTCSGLSGKTVPLEADFAPGLHLPPAHPACRCWIRASLGEIT